MMQQVDLLKDGFEPRRELLEPGHLLWLWGGLVVLLALVSGWQALGAWQLAREQQGREAQWQVLAEQNRALGEAVRDQADPALAARAQLLRQRVRTAELLSAAVHHYAGSNGQGFSGYLADLAAGHVSGTALSRIHLQEGGAVIDLHGQADAATKVPRLLQALSRGQRFRGHSFDLLQLESRDSGLLAFRITGPGEAGAP
jgi:hypothetical protein